MMTTEDDLEPPDVGYEDILCQRLEWPIALLRHINPHDSAEKCDRVTAAVHDATGGSGDGLKALAAWYRQRGDYPGDMAMLFKWKELQAEPATANGFAVLCRLVEDDGFDPFEICASTEPTFEPSMYEVVVAATKPTSELSRYSLAGKLEALERDAVNEVQILNGLSLLGTLAVLYAMPNLGKTLIMMWLLIETIKQGVIDPSRVYYINVDDSLAGLIEKLRIAEEFGFNMVAEGYQGFRANLFLRIVNEMIEKDDCRGVIVVLDVLKKFVDTMSKREATEFGKVMRRFVMKGGTCIYLAHTNKRPGHDGLPVYGGTSDVMEDVDNAYIGHVVSAVDAREKVVVFRSTKVRGNVKQRAAFSYSTEEALTYEQRLASVRSVPEGDAIALQEREELRSDEALVQACKECIQGGITTKMRLGAAIAERTGCSNKAAIRVIDKFTGNDAAVHEWTFDFRERGSKVFRLLDKSESSSEKNF